jgi:hypothetical protein
MGQGSCEGMTRSAFRVCLLAEYMVTTLCAIDSPTQPSCHRPLPGALFASLGSVFVRYFPHSFTMRPAIVALRERLHQLTPSAFPGVEQRRGGCATGVSALDALLGGGVPRGRITEIVGARAVGRTTLMRRIVAQQLQAQQWVAIIDATRTLAPQDWCRWDTSVSPVPRLLVVRPHDPEQGAWCADRLVRSGCFRLVVLDGAPPLSRTHTVRLSQLARDRDVALLAVHAGSAAATGGGTIRLRCVPSTRSTVVGIAILVDRGATPGRTPMARRLPLVTRLPVHPPAADRRLPARQRA